MISSSLEYYKDLFMNLRTSKSGGLKAPHKAILMLTVTEMVRDGIISTPSVVNDDLLKRHFVDNWHKYINIQSSFVGDVNMPFSHIGSEKFVVSSSPISFEIDRMLFLLMQETESAESLIACLISTYLAPFAFEHRIHFNEINPYRDRTLRDYQIEGKAKIYQMWTQVRSIMFQMPTGTGKTKLFVSIARDLFDWGAQRKMAVKILFLAHRIELVDQISENLGMKYGLAHGLIMAQNREQKIYPLQVASVQTITRRLDGWSDKDFDVVIIDEAHHVKAFSYKRILRIFPRAKVLGVTATPYRMSHESFRPEFDDLITSAPVARFIKDKWLCDYEYYSIRPDSKIQIDINSIKRFALDGDYLDEAAADIMDRDKIRADIVAAYECYAKGKKGIVYTITKAHNLHVCNKFIERGYKAVAIDDKTPPQTRKNYVDDFKKGKIDIICNVNIFSEGFDCPDLEFILLARPTKSLSMYLQQVGRGLRPAPGKDKLIILDCVGLYNRFGFPSARRQWRHHFEGRDVDYIPLPDGQDGDGHGITYMKEYFEGDEDVEMLHSSTEDVVEEKQLTEESVVDGSNEQEFRFYLKQNGKDDNGIRRIIRGIKSDVDAIIRGKYDSHHRSVLYIDDVETLNLYLTDFRISPVMEELDNSKNRIMTDALGQYIDYLRWRQSDEYDTVDIISEAPALKSADEENQKRSLADVENEIRILKKWDKSIPEALLQEYQSLKRN
jgi:superfamily II DNA or RNA helicase